eukprot:Sspe_Gene.111624::Locus_93736_Transcript_1_1_Confidence_1.000_Length_315::g.111624::m.111624
MSIPLLSQKTTVAGQDASQKTCFIVRYFCGDLTCGWDVNGNKYPMEVQEYVWYFFEMQMNWDTNRMAVYVDGERVGEQSFSCADLNRAMFFGGEEQTSPSYFDEI